MLRYDVYYLLAMCHRSENKMFDIKEFVMFFLNFVVVKTTQRDIQFET
jgi:hypothetical protein